MGESVTSSRTQEFLSYWLPPVLGTLAVLALSGDCGSAAQTRRLVQWLLTPLTSLSPAQIDMVHGYLRKAGHMVAYGVLYFLWFRAFRGNLGYRLSRSFLLGLCLCLTLALVDEGRQALLSSRTGSLRDVALDLSGVALSALAAPALAAPRRSRDLVHPHR